MAESKNPTPKIVKRPSAQVFDVAGPGIGLSASHTSRALITNNGPTTSDPMVNEQPVADPAPPAKKPIIKPLHEVAEVKGELEPVAPAIEEKPTEPEVEQPEPEELPGVPSSSDQRDEEDRVARDRAARLQKMIDEEEYFLPIQTTEQRRSRKVGIIGIVIIILLAVAWYNIALDAALLPNTYNLPHTTFFTVK